MNLLLLQIFSLLAGCVVASLLDLRKEKIPNKLTFGMMVMGALFAFFHLDYNYSVLWIVNFIVAFLITYTLWSIKAWGGGDAKLFWAIVSLAPFIPWHDSLSKLTIIPPLLLWLACLLLIRFFVIVLSEQIKEKTLQGLSKVLRPQLAKTFTIFACLGLVILLRTPIFVLPLLLSAYTTSKCSVTQLRIRLAPYLTCALILSLFFDITGFFFWV